MLRPPSVFVLAAVVGGSPYQLSARTLAQSSILLIPATTFRTVFDRDIEFARAVVGELSDAGNNILIELKNQKLRSSIGRLADWLLRADGQSGGSHRFTLPFDKRMLASQLGMTPEHLSRNLKRLSGNGVVIAGRNITVEDRAALAAVAGISTLLDRPGCQISKNRTIGGTHVFQLLEDGARSNRVSTSDPP
jgi:CRP/FNR family transcriptional regulator, transcriptional activator FtrB